MLAKYRQGSCTPREKMLVERWYLERAAELPPYTDDVMEREAGRQERSIWQAVAERTGGTSGRRDGWFNSFRSFLVAAAVILFAAVFAFYFITSRGQGTDAAHVAVNDIAPGTNRAVLTLADGRAIDLDSTHTSIVVSKSEIMYADGTPLHNADPAEVQLLTLTTPRRGTYQVILPDGSKVWLNAGSTLKYPSRFEGQRREVELTGEGYFEIVKATQRVALSREIATKSGRDSSGWAIPFYVRANGQQIQVISTEFNVAAYPDENKVTTTLVEGAVRVSINEGTIGLLKPGKEAVSEGESLTIRTANTASAISWKNGDFIFENEPLESIMKKLERWYGVTIVYQGNPEGLRFYGMVSREKSIKSVLEVMEMTGKVKFRIEGTGADPEERRVVVML